MTDQVFRVDEPSEYQKAGPADLIRLLPVKGTNPLFVPKYKLELLVLGITSGELVHMSGPTGSAKTSLIEALYLVPGNFGPICSALKVKQKPLRVFGVQMATYEAPGELYQRRSLSNGTTYDEPSGLVQALTAAAESNGEYCLIWLREIGRTHSSSVQGGLLDLMCRGQIALPDGTCIDGRGIARVADSNYQAESDATYTLVTLDTGLKRRFTLNLTLGYLSAEQEVAVLRHLMQEESVGDIDDELLVKVVRLGQVIRRHRSDGNLTSVPPPTIYGYLAFLRLARALPHLSLQQLATATLLGNASSDDEKHISVAFNEVFGLQADQDDDPTKGGGLF